jgi:hypothetical protein
MKVPTVKPEMFPGWLGELVDATAACTEASPAAIGMQALVALGNAVGRGPHAYVGETRHSLNEFALIVGDTSTSGKGDSRHVALAPIEEADQDWRRLICSGLSSGEGVIHAVRDAVYGLNRKGEKVLTDAGVTDKRLLVVETEFSQALKMFRREGNILSNVLRDLWDGKYVLRTLTKTSPTVATEAHISVIGHTTPRDLCAHLADLDVANGMGNRFLFVATDRVRLLPSPPRLPQGTRDRLAQHVRNVLTHARQVQELRRTERAEDLWCTLYPELKKPRPGLRGQLLARGAPHLMRLGGVFTLLDLKGAVDVSHLAAAAAWWDYCAESVDVIFGGRTGDDAADRIRLELLPGQRLSLTDIREQIFGGHISAGKLRNALELLQKLGEVRIEEEETAGRPRIMVARRHDARPRGADGLGAGATA